MLRYSYAKLRALFFASLLFTTFASLSAAGIVTGSLSGTCGFFQGSPSNVVFSESFTQTSGGNGTFCTDFLSGGSFVQNLTVQLGDKDNSISVYGAHSAEVHAPSGYGAFISFDETFQFTQQFVVNSVVPSSATNTSVQFSPTGYGQDLSSTTGGSCSTTGSINLPGSYAAPAGYNPSFPLLPAAVGETFSAIETLHMACDQYSLPGYSAWSNDSYYVASVGTFLIRDANGNLIALGSLTAVPEPRSAWLLAVLALPLLVITRFATAQK